MRLFTSKLSRKNNIFFGEADSFSIIRGRTSKDKLLTDLKAACLLYDHVILAAAYFWQSRTVYSLLTEVEPLICSGDVLPAIRDARSTRDASDYLEKRIQETSAYMKKSPVYKIPAIASEIAKPTQLPIANRLNNIGTFLHLDTGSIEAQYRNLWISDIKPNRDPNSLNNIISATFPENKQKKALMYLASINKGPFFSRSIVSSYILRMPIENTFKSLMIQRASDLYLLSNALSMGSDLLITSTSSGHLLNSYSRSFGALSKANINIFLKILELCGLTPNTIAELPASALLNLKYSQEFTRFKEIYIDLVEKAECEKDNLAEEIQRTFVKLQRLEFGKKTMIKTLSVIEAISSGIFLDTVSGIILTSLTPAAPTILLGSGLATTLTHFLKRLEGINETPISDLSKLIEDGQFQKRILSSFPGRI